MITEAKGKLFRIIGGRVLYAEDVADGAGYYELRGDRTWDITLGPSPNPNQVRVNVHDLRKSLWGTAHMKLYKHALASEEEIVQDCDVYRVLIQARSKLVVAPKGVPMAPSREQ